MTVSDPIEILLRHDRWATGEIVRACEGIGEEKFHRRFEMGPGSLHDTLVHICGAMLRWTDVLEEREVKARPEDDGRRTPAEIMPLLDRSARELGGVARRMPLDGIVTRVREGQTYRYTRGVVLTHVTTHGMHHRAQCLNMLRQVGVSPLPKSSVTEWALVEG